MTSIRPPREFHGLRVATDHWPVIVIDFPDKRVIDSALRDCLLHLEELLRAARDRREKTYTVTDLSRMVEFPPGAQREYAAEWTKRTLELQKAASLGGATVSRSSMLCALINAVQRIVPPAMPSVFVATREEAFAHAIGVFDAARVSLRPDLRTALSKR